MSLTRPIYLIRIYLYFLRIIIFASVACWTYGMGKTDCPVAKSSSPNHLGRSCFQPCVSTVLIYSNVKQNPLSNKPLNSCILACSFARSDSISTCFSSLVDFFFRFLFFIFLGIIFP